MLEQLLIEYKITNQNPNLTEFESNLTYNSAKNSWELSKNFDASQSCLVIKDQFYVYQDFLDYLNKNQKSVNKKWSTNQLVKKQYASFLEQSVFQYKKENLENENRRVRSYYQ